MKIIDDFVGDLDEIIAKDEAEMDDMARIAMEGDPCPPFEDSKEYK